MRSEALDAQPRIFIARNVITLSSANSRAFATVGDRVVATGSPSDLRARYTGAEIVDFGDAIVAPGFNDAHMHLATAAEDLLHTDLSPVSARTTVTALELLHRAAAATVPGQWVRASRYDDAKMSGPPLSRSVLDEVTRDHPVLVVHVAGHWGVANSRALRLAGVDETTAAPEGGQLGRDADGRLNGIVYERSLQRFTYASRDYGPPLIEPSDMDDLLVGLDRAQRLFHAAGVTSVTDANVDLARLELFREAQKRDRLTARVNTLIQYDSLQSIRDRGLLSELGDGNLRFAGVKAMMDGAIGGRTCLLEAPYEGRPDDRGMQTLSQADLAKIVRDVLGAGLRLCVHANGDRAIRMLIAELDSVGPLCSPQARHRIEHCSLVTDDILRVMRRLGLVAIPFGGYPYYHGRRLIEWYGRARVERMFAHRSFLDAGIPVAGSSDFPCGPHQPLVSMQSCVTRRGEDGSEIGLSQRITALEALRLFTVAAAYATAEEQVKGRIAPGQLADFVVLGGDPLTTDPLTLGAIPVLETYVGARQVWSAGP